MPDIISHEYYGKKDPPKLPNNKINNNGDYFDLFHVFGISAGPGLL
jgi:hypothetical protein